MTIYRAEGFPQVEIKSKPNARARRLTLRRDSRDGSFSISHPKRISKREIKKFLDDHSDWIAKHYKPVETITYGSTLTFRGLNYKVVEGDKRGVRIEGNHFAVKSENPGKSVASFLKIQAQIYAPSRVDAYANALNTHVTSIRWRDPKTRWGSCDSNGVVMLSWRLIMAPDDIFDYVIAHEVAHRLEMNHSQRFWDVVNQIYPDNERARKWLRMNGAEIQSILF